VAFESPERLKEIEEAWFSKPSREDLATSRTRLMDLGKALLIYANDHDDRLPDDLMDVKEYAGVGFSWLYSNVAYVGSGMTTADRPDRPVAYDKTLIESGNGTNILYLDSHVAYEHVDQLERFGIKRDPNSPVVMRPVSARRLANLGKALLVYTVDRGKYPDSLDQMTPYLPSDDLAWLENNAEYLGKGKAETMRPDTVMAYDKTLLEGNLGTNVLYLDCHVAFETPERLEKLSIRSKTAERVLVANRMRRLALAAIMHAHEHEGGFADELTALKPYVRDDGEFAWMLANTTYLGKGVTVQVRNPAQKPLAYSVASDGATIAFFDGHVEFVPRDRLKELGIEPAR
jgi:prepilin-type processing-associated H-X9-DG protein